MTAQASGADIDLFLLALDQHRGLLDVGQPLPFGMAIGVTDVMTKRNAFSADFTLHDDSFDSGIALL